MLKKNSVRMLNSIFQENNNNNTYRNAIEKKQYIIKAANK